MILQAVGMWDAGLLPPDFCADSVFSIKYKFKTRQGAGALRRSELGPQEGREPRPHWASGVPRATQSGGAPQSGGGPPSSLLHAPTPLHRCVPTLLVPFFCPARSVKVAGSDICAATAWVLDGEEIP